MRKRAFDEEQDRQQAEETAGLEAETKQEEPLGEVVSEPPTVKKRKPKHVKYVRCI